MTNEQEDSLAFYTINSYLAINNLMYGNVEKAIKGAIASSEDAKGVLKEAETIGIKKRFGLKTDEEALKRYNQFKNRTFDKTKNEEIQRIMKITLDDIQNIKDCMTPLTENLILYRNIPTQKFYVPSNDNPIILMKSFISTSLYSHDKSYRNGKDFVQLQIEVPKGIPAIRYDKMTIQNEPDEVLLHPVKCEITDIENANIENCEKIVKLKVLDIIPINLNELKEKTEKIICHNNKIKEK